MKFFNVLLTTTLALSSCAVLAQLTEHQPKILFDAGEWTDGRQIYVMDPDGSNLQRLTEKQPGTVIGGTAWSPDHQKIAFSSNRDGDPEVYVMDADGSNVQRLTRHRGRDEFPFWSPDGNQIFFLRGNMDPPRNSRIYVMDSDGSNERLTELPPHWGSSWSPDGERIVFVKNFDGFNEIYVMDSDGSNVQQLTHTPSRDAYNLAPEWSPDGQKIVFDSTRDGNFEIYVMDPDGSNVQRLTHNDKVDARPAWSPDGQKIVFHSLRDSSSDQPPYLDPAVYLEFEIYVMDADGGNVERLTSNNRFDAHPDW